MSRFIYALGPCAMRLATLALMFGVLYAIADLVTSVFRWTEIQRAFHSNRASAAAR
jgi:hypothetical protein